MSGWKAIIGLNSNNELIQNPRIFCDEQNYSWFYSITENNPVIIGHKTLEMFKTFHRKVLIEVSSENSPQHFTFSNLDTIKKFIDIQLPTAQPFVVGGKELFESSFSLCDALIIYKETVKEEGLSFKLPDTFIKYGEVLFDNSLIEIYVLQELISNISQIQLDKIFQNNSIVLKGE